MKYKVNEDGSIVVKDGQPVVIGEDGKEFSIDAIGAANKIKELSAENKTYRQKASGYKKDLEKFKDIEDPTKAVEALRTVASIGDDHKVEIETLKTNINTAWESKLGEKDTEIKSLKDNLFNTNVLNKFATSEQIGKTVLPAGIAAATFGKHFNHDGSANDVDGNMIYSKSKPGEPADFEESIEIIINNYPGKEAILKPTMGSGSGSGSEGNVNNNTGGIAAGLSEIGIK